MLPAESIPKKVQLALLIFGTATVISLTIVARSWRDEVAADQLPAAIDAFNSTLGFHRVYAAIEPNNIAESARIVAIAGLLSIELQFINVTTRVEAETLKQKYGFQASISDIVELDTHRRIYSDMEANNVQSAAIIGRHVDAEMDLKTRLAQAFEDIGAEIPDMLFISHTHSERSEPGVAEMQEILDATRDAQDASHREQRRLAKDRFAHRQTRAFRPRYPRGIGNAYAINLRTARRLNRRGLRRMQMDGHDLDFILADMAMVGISLAYSVSPPPVVGLRDKQRLLSSVLAALSMRDDNPAAYAPFVDWQNTW